MFRHLPTTESRQPDAPGGSWRIIPTGSNKNGKDLSDQICDNSTPEASKMSSLIRPVTHFISLPVTVFLITIACCANSRLPQRRTAYCLRPMFGLSSPILGSCQRPAAKCPSPTRKASRIRLRWWRRRCSRPQRWRWRGSGTVVCRTQRSARLLALGSPHGLPRRPARSRSRVLSRGLQAEGRVRGSRW